MADNDFWARLGEGAQSVVQTMAPAIATLAGGPLAGTAVQALSTALFGKPDADPEATAQALNTATPEQLIALKQADNDLTEKMKQADVNLAGIEAGDRDSARKSNNGDYGPNRDWLPRVLALLVVGAFVITAAGLTIGWSHADSVLAGTMVGYLSAKAEQVMSYYFGSSAGSDRKTEIIAQTVPSTTPSAADKEGGAYTLPWRKK